MKVYNKGTLKIREINLNSFIPKLEFAKKTNNLIDETNSEWNDHLRNYKIDLEFISAVFENITPKGDERRLENNIYKSYTPKLVFIKNGAFMEFYFFSDVLNKAYSYEGHNKIKLEPKKKLFIINETPKSNFVSTLTKINNMEIFTDGTSSTFIEINQNSFISVVELAKKNNARIRIKDPRFKQHLFKLDVDMLFVQKFIKKLSKPKLTIITKGLMAGFYIYSFDDNKVFYYLNNTKGIKIEPLKKYSLTNDIPEFDFVISYSNKDIDLTREIFQILNFSFNIYFLDVEKVKEDPLWQIRYREAMYHSHYFIPVFSEKYLTTNGALSEFFESVYLNIDFRTITFYNYFIPFVLGDLSYEKIKSYIFNNEKKHTQHFDYDTKLFYEILNDINYGIKLKNHSFKEIVTFLKSILTNNKSNLRFLMNNKNEFEGNSLKDIKFLKLLLKQTEYVVYSNLSESEFNGKKMYALKIVTLFIENSNKRWNILDITSDGRCINRQFTTEIQDDAIIVNEQTFNDISKFLNL